MAMEPKEIMEWPSSAVESALPASHPMAYYLYSVRLIKDGNRKDALFWYYVGELRYRFYLAANPHLPPDGAPALFASLHSSVSTAVADPSHVDRAMSVKQFRRALDWDAANDNGVTSKSSHHKEWLEIRAVLSDDVGLAKQSDDR
jgi:hypothetical protein